MKQSFDEERNRDILSCTLSPSLVLLCLSHTHSLAVEPCHASGQPCSLLSLYHLDCSPPERWKQCSEPLICGWSSHGCRKNVLGLRNLRRQSHKEYATLSRDVIRDLAGVDWASRRCGQPSLNAKACSPGPVTLTFLVLVSEPRKPLILWPPGPLSSLPSCFSIALGVAGRVQQAVGRGRSGSICVFLENLMFSEY